MCEYLKAAPQAACSGARGLRIQKKPELMFRLIVTVVSGGVYTVGGVVTFGAGVATQSKQIASAPLPLE